MTRTYWIRYNTMNGWKFDKVIHKSTEDRQRFHKVEALDRWKEEHKGYGLMTARNVYTKQEMKANGYM